ncbi:uncharacterized protein [Periplaneta americana]|uniref:uncharacterized protein n=1 Tax=Periplaneta americana TaxID=6978 RepID=UPI0037E74A5E
MEHPKRISSPRDTQRESPNRRQDLQENISGPHEHQAEAFGQNVYAQPRATSTHGAEATLQFHDSYGEHQGFYCIPLVHAFSNTESWYRNDLQVTQLVDQNLYQLPQSQVYRQVENDSYNQHSPCQEYSNSIQCDMHVNYSLICDTCKAMNLHNNQSFNFQGQPYINSHSSQEILSQRNCNMRYLQNQEFHQSPVYQVQGEEGTTEAETAEIHENGVTEEFEEYLASSREKVQIWLDNHMDDTKEHEKDVTKYSVVDRQDNQITTEVDYNAPEFKPQEHKCFTPFEESPNDDFKDKHLGKGLKEVSKEMRCSTSFEPCKPTNDDSVYENLENGPENHPDKRKSSTLFKQSPNDCCNDKDLGKDLENDQKGTKYSTSFEECTNDDSCYKNLEKAPGNHPNRRRSCTSLEQSSNDGYDFPGDQKETRCSTSFEESTNDDSYYKNLKKKPGHYPNRRKSCTSFEQSPNEGCNDKDLGKDFEGAQKETRCSTSFEACANGDSKYKNLEKGPESHSNRRKSSTPFKQSPNVVKIVKDLEKCLEDDDPRETRCYTSFEACTTDDYDYKNLDKGSENHPNRRTSRTSFNQSATDGLNNKGAVESIEDHSSSFKEPTKIDVEDKNLGKILEVHRKKRTENINPCTELKTSSRDDVGMLQEENVSLKLTYSEIVKKQILKPALQPSQLLPQNEKVHIKEIKSSKQWPSLQDTCKNYETKLRSSPKHSSRWFSRTISANKLTSSEHSSLRNTVGKLVNIVSEENYSSKIDANVKSPRKLASNAHNHSHRSDSEKFASVLASSERNSKGQSEKDGNKKVNNKRQ